MTGVHAGSFLKLGRRGSVEWEGYSLPQLSRGSVSIVSSASGVRGGAPAENEFGTFLGLQNRSSGSIMQYFIGAF